MRTCASKMAGAIVTALMLSLLMAAGAWSAEFERRDVTFKSQGVKCAAWFYVPKNLKAEEKRPAIVMAHGYSGVKEMGLDKFAEKFADAGFAVLVFDYRYFGASEGEPRGQLFYYEQQQDYRNAVTWVSLQKEVDSDRIGIWGTSYSGGHVLHLGAFDKRVKAVVAMEPAVAMWETYFQKMPAEQLAQLRAWFAANRRDEHTKGAPNYIPAFAIDGQPAAVSNTEAFNLMTEAAKVAPTWRNRITVESLEIGMEYTPAAYIHLISPTPLLMIVPENDKLVPTEVQKNAFARAGEPKKMVLVKGGHFDLFRGPGLVEASTAAVEWFRQNLMRK